MRLSMQLDYSTLRDVQNALKGLPARIEANVFRAAGRKGAKVVADAIRQRTPVQKRPTKQSKQPHLRDTVTVKQKTYRRGKGASLTYFAIGWGSPQKANAHLVEEGTAQRFTGSKTEYQPTAGKRIKTKRGGWVFRKGKKSIGSKAVTGAVRANRGVMPALRPTHNAYAAVQAAARNAMVDEVRRKLNSELRSASKRNQRAFGGLG